MRNISQMAEVCRVFEALQRIMAERNSAKQIDRVNKLSKNTKVQSNIA